MLYANEKLLLRKGAVMHWPKKWCQLYLTKLCFKGVNMHWYVVALQWSAHLPSTRQSEFESCR